MFLSDYDYELPDRLIARYPTAERRGSRLLLVDAANDRREDRRFAELPGLLSAGDLLVLNDTRVIRARLFGRKSSGGKIEVMVERMTGEHSAVAHLRASKTPKPGAVIEFAERCTAIVNGRSENLFDLEFSTPIAPFLEAHGALPLPPYLNREADASDDLRYQTVYADRPGAVAAPTAGLHFDQAMLDELAALGVEHTFVTLHVGAGTFQTLKHDAVDDNELHAERIELGAVACAAIRKARQCGGRVVAVGTTSVRVLESAAREGSVDAFSGETDLFIRPGFEFRAVDAMLTNFHLPRSSLMMLVSAFAGRERILDAYRHAVASEYRFFSYGDAMLLIPEIRKQ
jgi:S-adenosylmethionine:tRNA ribosyltransferase-isomerase